MRDPARTIPLATIVGTILAAVIYIVSTVGVMSLVRPDALASSTAPFADGARAGCSANGWQDRRHWRGDSCLGALNGWTLIAGSSDGGGAMTGCFPGLFARLSVQEHAGARDDRRVCWRRFWSG